MSVEEKVREEEEQELMESGDMCVEIIGLLLMQEWCVANWDTLQ